MNKIGKLPMNIVTAVQVTKARRAVALNLSRGITSPGEGGIQEDSNEELRQKLKTMTTSNAELVK